MNTTSTSNRVTARSSGFPAARAADAVQESPGGMRIATILVPVDFSASSVPACEFALDLAARFGARVNLLHVIENNTLPDFEKFPLVRNPQNLIAKVKKDLVVLARKGGHPVVPVQAEVRVGSPWQEIVAAASRLNADLIVLPTHGYSGLKHLLLGSVAERVVRHAPCPVLVLRTPAPKRPKEARATWRGTYPLTPIT